MCTHDKWKGHHPIRSAQSTIFYFADGTPDVAEIGKTEKSRKCREVLDTALYLIRFPAMTVQEFADTVATSGVLTLQETTDLFLHFTAKEKPSIGRFGASITRKGLPRQTCRRFASSHYRSNQWRYRGRTDSIQFSVDKRVFIIGFGLYGSSNGR